jgi:sigma-B regulation protein RsbU (phosphoserine phosphatase)
MNDDYLSFYLLDVSGHGVPSALLTVTVNKMLSSRSHEVNPIYDSRTNELVSTGTVLRELNARFQLEEDTSQYFTIVFGMLNLKTGAFEVAQAGHPPPIVQDRQGAGRLVGEGGFPIGWLPELDFDNVALNLEKGSRLILYSDGISECTNTRGEMYGGDRLKSYFERMRPLPLKQAMDGMIGELQTWKEGVPFNDDISLLAIERIPDGEETAKAAGYTDSMSPAAS